MSEHSKKAESTPSELVKLEPFGRLSDEAQAERCARLIDIALQQPRTSSIEKAKLAIELEKIKLERDKLLVSVFIEDFKARWQELLNFENENSRWQTLYVTALLLVISWVLSNSGQDGRYKSLGDIFAGDNSFFLLSLALINAVYTLAMAYKGFQIQEIAQYIYVRIGHVVTKKTGAEFDSWERWRRDEKGQPTSIRSFYYFIIGILPTAVSATILILYANYGYSKAPFRLNVFYYFTSIFVLLTLILALWTLRMNSRWDAILRDRSDD